MKYQEAKQRSPLAAIRQFCLDCVCGEVSEVTNCSGNIPYGPEPKKPCILWPYRMRRKPKEWDKATFGPKRSPGRAIVFECRRCQGVTRQTNPVLDCNQRDCALWPRRMGVPDDQKRTMSEKALKALEKARANSDAARKRRQGSADGAKEVPTDV